MQKSLPAPRQETYDVRVHAEGAIGMLAVEATEEEAAKVVQAEQLRQEAAAHLVKHQESSLSRFGEHLRTSTNHFARAEKKQAQADQLDQESAVHEAEIAISLDHTRKILGTFDRDQSGVLDLLLSEENVKVSPFITSLKPEGMSWAEWISDKEKGASDEQLLNFLQWHEDHYARHNSLEDSVDQVEQADRLARERFSRASELGVVPPAVIAAIDRHRNQAGPAKFVFQDIVRLAAYHALGYAEGTEKSINIPSLESEGTLLHEFSHIQIGSLGDRRPSTRWINEAVTEALAMAAATETADVYTYQDGESYPVERALLRSVIDSSNGKISRDMMIEAYACEDIPEASAMRQTLLAAVDRHITDIFNTGQPRERQIHSFFGVLDSVRADNENAFSNDEELRLLELAIVRLQRTLPADRRLPNLQSITDHVYAAFAAQT